MADETPSDSPGDVARDTLSSDPGDVADQGDRLAMIMEAEAVRNGMAGGSGEGSLDGLELPLQDDEFVLASEGAEDASDDPMHAGGLTPRPIVEPEVSAMHVVDDVDPARDFYLDDESDAERADADFDQFDEPVENLTPEDQTLMGIDPYE
jgi:hypothetical protein